MLSIFICEDDKYQRNAIETMAKNYIAKGNYKDIEIVLSTDNPKTLLLNLDTHYAKQSLYILDVDLQHEMSGIDLAAKIRKRDMYGKIVFVTTHQELSYLTFKYKVEAMDYIIKDMAGGIEKRVEECIGLAYKHFANDKHAKKRGYQVKVGNGVRLIPYDEIMYFESSTHSPRKIILHMENSWLEFYGSLSEVEKISDEFFRCHQSFVVNVKNINSVDKEKRVAEMQGGRSAFIAVRKMGTLIKKMSGS